MIMCRVCKEECLDKLLRHAGCAHLHMICHLMEIQLSACRVGECNGDIGDVEVV